MQVANNDDPNNKHTCEKYFPRNTHQFLKKAFKHKHLAMRHSGRQVLLPSFFM